MDKLTATELSSEDKQALAGMIAEQLGWRNSNHTCWLYVLNQKEYDILKKYVDGPTCPLCGKGRIVLEIFKGDIAGDSLWLKCYWGEKGCKFRECANDPDRED